MAKHYADYTYPLSAALIEVHQRTWNRLAEPGAWWTAAERHAIAQETRAADQCQLCLQRKQALSVHGVIGDHDRVSDLPDATIDAIHRITTDPGRLTKDWFDRLITDDFTDGHYIEMLGVIILVFSFDRFCRGLDIPPHPLPSPQPGAPSQYRPTGLVDQGAWVVTLPESQAKGKEADIYEGMRSTGNIIRAMSIVPQEVRSLLELQEVHFLGNQQIAPIHPGRELERPQMELVAARVAALRECFY